MSVHRKSIPYLLLLPLFAFISAFLFYPIIRAIYMAFTYNNMLDPNNIGAFAGLANFSSIIRGSLFVVVFRNTIVYTLGVVAGSIGLGMISALLLNQTFIGRKVARTLNMLPWAVPPVAAGLMWIYMFNPQAGIINFVLQSLNFISGTKGWLDNMNLAMLSVLIVKTWLLYPFTMVVILGALQSIEKDQVDAALLDGAKPVQVFWYIKIPEIRSVIDVLILLETIWAVRDFAIIYVLTEGGPAHATDTLAIQTYIAAFAGLDFGRAAAFGVAMLIMSMVFAFIYLRYTQWKEQT